MNLSVSNVQSRSLNCCNCGAALAPADVVCPHCLSRNAVDLMAIKQFRLLDEQPDEACPNGCGSLTLVALDGFNCVARHCMDCKGLFLGPGMLDTILKRIGHEVFEINHDRLKSIHELLIKKDSVVYKPCPECKQLMWRKAAVEGCSIIADHCREHGVWLDAGELTVLAEWLEAGGRLKKEEDDKIAAKVWAVSQPRSLPIPSMEEDDTQQQFEINIDTPLEVIGMLAGGLGFVFFLLASNFFMALLALGVTAVAAWQSKPGFAGLGLGLGTMVIYGLERDWSLMGILLAIVFTQIVLVAGYKIHLQNQK